MENTGLNYFLLRKDFCNVYIPFLKTTKEIIPLISLLAKFLAPSIAKDFMLNKIAQFKIQQENYKKSLNNSKVI